VKLFKFYFTCNHVVIPTAYASATHEIVFSNHAAVLMTRVCATNLGNVKTRPQRTLQWRSTM